MFAPRCCVWGARRLIDQYASWKWPVVRASLAMSLAPRAIVRVVVIVVAAGSAVRRHAQDGPDRLDVHVRKHCVRPLDLLAGCLACSYREQRCVGDGRDLGAICYRQEWCSIDDHDVDLIGDIS